MKVLLLAFLICLPFLSCSTKSTTTESIDVSSEERPSLVLHKATYVVASGTVAPLTITADAIVIDDKSKTAKLTGVSFNQEDKNGIHGVADSVVVNTESHDAELKGNIRIEKTDDGFILTTDAVDWNDQDGILSTSDDQVVSITFDKTNTLKAIGFKGNVEQGSYQFGSIAEGVVSDGENNSPVPAEGEEIHG